MVINLKPHQKPFALKVSDLAFLMEQIRFQPLDANGNPVRPTTVSIDPVTKQITFSDGTNTWVYTDSLDYRGVRYVDGFFNNLENGQQTFGQANTPFLRFTNADWANYVKPHAAADAGSFYANKGFVVASNPAPDYSIVGNTTAGVTTVTHLGSVVDYTPRMISQTVANSNPAENAAYAAIVNDGGSVQADGFIRNLNTLPGDPSTSGFFTLFGQFFDHGLDFIAKDSAQTITVPLAADDPMHAGADGVVGTADDVNSIKINRAQPVSFDASGNPQYTNHTSPFIDQSQSYGSVAQITNLLREWVLDPLSGTYRPGMHLFDGSTLVQAWTKWDGTATHETLPTLNELRAHLVATGRDDLSWEDISNYRNRDAQGHVATGGAAGTTGEAVVLDMNPHLDHAHVTLAAADAGVHRALGGASGVTDIQFGPAYPGGPEMVTSVTVVDAAGASTTYALSALFDFATNSIRTGLTDAGKAVMGEILLESIGDHYIAGDGRVNENFGLTSIHHVFHEEHNFNVDNLISTMASALADPASGFTATDIHQWQINTGTTDASGNYVYADNSIAWDQDALFQSAKLITEMEYQHVAIDQYARLVTPDLPEFVTYDSGINSSISLEYAQAAFRFGHSQLRETIDAILPKSDGTFDITQAVTRFALAQAFLSPQQYASNGPGAIALGMSHQVSSEIDEFVTPALQQTLLGQPLDLAAINIARGRDLGLPTLNETRAQLFAAAQAGNFVVSGDLHPYTSWSDFGANMIHPESLVNFIAAYSFDGDVAHAQAVLDAANGVAGALNAFNPEFVGNDQAAFDYASAFLNGGDQGFNRIDLWLGGLAERHVFTGQLGATFNAIFVDQMERLMDGDRFYYLYRLLGALPQTTELNIQIVTEQFKDIVERTTGLTHLNGSIFSYADSNLELSAKGSAADRATQGAEHKYGDTLDAYAASHGGQHIGIYSHWDGVTKTTSGNGLVVTVAGQQYINDNRPDAGANPDGTPSSGYNSHEVIAGSEYNDRILAGDGDDTIYGDGGNDYLDGGAGADHIYGGDGKDTIFGGDLPDFLDGGAGDDTIYAGTSSGVIDIVIGGDGNDRLFGEAGIDEIYGGNGDDYIDAGSDTDVVEAGDGNDYITGGDGPDTLYGGRGDDVVDGGTGDDVLFGQEGDDILQPGVGAAAANDGDRLDGGTGFDLASYVNVAAGLAVTADLRTANVDRAGALGNTYLDLEGVIGSRSADALIGDAANNWLIGGGGDDTFGDLAGADKGNLGNDVIVGGSISLNDINAIIAAVGDPADRHFLDRVSDPFLSAADKMLGDGGAAGANGDVVVFSGKRNDYTITQSFINGHTVIRVVDAVANRDGNDVIVDVQRYTFADGTRTLATLFNLPPVHTGPAIVVDAPEGTTSQLGVVALLQGWSDPDNDPIAATNIALASGQPGYLYNPGNGQLFYQSVLGDTSQAVLNYQVSDGHVVVPTTATIDLQPLNHVAGATNGSNNLNGSANADYINGLGGSDNINGGGGNDVLVGGAGADNVNGGANNDVLVAISGDGNDSYDGGSGNDTIDLSRTTVNAVINLAGSSVSSAQVGNDSLSSVENAIGSSGNDTITASTAKNVLTGWLGNDTFVFTSTGQSAPGANRDVITDFVIGQDTINLSGIDADTTIAGGGPGGQAFVWDGLAAAGAAARGHLGFHYEFDANGIEHTIVEGNVNNTAAPEFQLDLIGHYSLTATDFLL